MWQSLSDRLYRLSTRWMAGACLLVFLLFAAFALPAQASRSEAVTAEAGSPDMSFYYSAERLYLMADSYGEDGRKSYVEARLTFDFLWPLVYGSFLGVGISWTFRHAFARDSRWRQANLVPILAVLLDFLENGSTSLVMVRYPTPTPPVDQLAGVFTMAKWIFVVGSFALLLIGTSAAGVRWVKVRRNG